ncbi:DUF1684 domain-containing protein [Patescibacteria group bacterium]|nr:DUF1684 domain-containing protein [Patescibacteria group bacterium]
MDKLVQFREDKDTLFGKEAESPLTSEQKKGFKGLNYFAPKTSLIFHNLKIEAVMGDQLIQIKTSAGDTQGYKIKGKIAFEVDGTPSELVVYDSTGGSGLFLPFRDKTNQSETYHDGRYVEVEEENGRIVELDFNYAYNPYCAYNENFRCPITPEGNTLSVSISAGEKKFH